MDIPSTSVIKHWVAWGVTTDCPDDYMEHDPERVKQFEAWLAEEKVKSFKSGEFDGGKRAKNDGILQERERIIKLLEALTTHDLCMLGEHHEDWVNNNTRGIIEVLTEWDSEPVALIKGENK